MSKEQYDLKTPTNYLKRKMFLDGAVTVQRFEEFRHPRIAKFEELARGFFWVPEEISLTKDKMDHKESSDAVKHIFTSNLLRQTALDSIHGPVVSIPELEALISNWSFFETNIHSKSYSHIIRNVYGVPKEEFNKIHDTTEIVDMAANIGRYYEALHILNCRKECGIDVDQYKHKKAIYLALHASYALEAFRFMVSFATSLAMVENKIYIGNGNIISLILQDEILHAEWTAWIINNVDKDDADFVKLEQECADEVYAMYMEVIKEEKDWAEYLFKLGPVIGLNAIILKDFVDYTAFNRLKDIGIKYLGEHPKSSPIPWFNRHVDINKKQSALQETESTNYVIGVMSDNVSKDELPEL
jgi:ribonucleoside-diphosphate reductase beta chain